MLLRGIGFGCKYEGISVYCECYANYVVFTSGYIIYLQVMLDICKLCSNNDFIVPSVDNDLPLPRRGLV